ncbi:hypothetical protein HUG20_16860 [Salicibibacter cibi]|uniref:Lipoprotein n=1 Tax=Salicibibacter cibi TaxID=2743001 RepID=A0A7T6ZDS0_9BACI|nr:hypothetical protein [Salicibibacter cibi]QQK81415.1 hypothetical protein HUG20_16860 [Salicibibacter cibi]
MKQYRYILFVVSALLLAACGDSEETDAEPENGNDETATEGSENEREDTGNEEEDAANEEGENGEGVEASDPDVSVDEDNATEEDEGGNGQGVEPGDPNDTNLVEFQRINWMMGSPEREPEPGIWLYTEDDHTEGDEDTFDFDEHDVLHYQTDDYMGHTLRAQQIILEDDDTARIIVDIHSEPNDSDDEEDYEMPRQHLNVEKDVLRDKSFIVEVEDGEELNIE